MPANLLQKTYSKIENLAFILLNITMADVCIFGAGRLIEMGPLTFRMVLLLLLFVLCIPAFFKNISKLFKSNYIRAVVIFAILLVFATVIGFVNNNRVGLIVTDIKGFIYFAFLPCVLVLVDSYEKATVLAKTTMYAGAGQALIHIVLICLHIADLPWFEKFCDFCYERRFFYVSYKISENNLRVSFLSLICLLLGVAFSIYFSTKTTSKALLIIYPLITALCGFSLFMSYTRSVYLAVGVMIVLLAVCFLLRMDKKEKLSVLRHLVITVVAFSIIFIGFGIKTKENYFTYGLSRMLVGIDLFKSGDGGEDSEISDEEAEEKDSFHQSTIESDNIRAMTARDLIINIKKSPIIGLGLGSEIPSRPDGLNEYFFLDLFSKMGIIGLLSYLAPVLFIIIQLIQLFRRKNKDFVSTATWFCILAGLIVYSYFTPCMNSSVGIIIYCCVMAVFEIYKKYNINLEEQL